MAARHPYDRPAEVEKLRLKPAAEAKAAGIQTGESTVGGKATTTKSGTPFRKQNGSAKGKAKKDCLAVEAAASTEKA